MRQCAGQGNCRQPNVFIERLWRSIKYEEVYLHAYESVGQARTGIGRYIEFYNTRRPHSSLQARTPDVVYFDSLPWPLVGDNWFVRRIDSVVLLPMLTCCLT